MSVLIKGMEMPTSCHKCVFGKYEVCQINLDISGKDPPYCPLVPVPEHGDLIDRDKLEKDIERYVGGEESRSRFHHWVQVQSVVIPRDKGEKA